MAGHRYRLLSLLNNTGVIKGRKKLQKMFHIVQSLGYDFDLKYSYHNYGPYSAQLQWEIDNFVDEQIVEEKREGNYYAYATLDLGKEITRKIKDKGLDESWPDVPPELISIVQDQDAQFLELVSTMIYLKKLGFKDSALYQKAKELKPHLIKHYGDAEKFMQELSRWRKEKTRCDCKRALKNVIENEGVEI